MLSNLYAFYDTLVAKRRSSSMFSGLLGLFVKGNGQLKLADWLRPGQKCNLLFSTIFFHLVCGYRNKGFVGVSLARL